MDGRTVSVEGYRFGFQNQEKDNEIKGEGNSYTTEFRQLDPRLGRWLSVDILVRDFEFISPYNFCYNNSIYFIDQSGKAPTDWYVNHKTGEYEWFEGNEKKKGYTGVGYYKVIYNSEKNILNIYAGKESILVQSMDMSTNSFGKYKTEQAAKFALIAAELGGEFVSNEDPTVQPLIIGASIDNRLRLSKLGIKSFSIDGTVQGISGYQAMSKKAYSDFKYGNTKRFGTGESAFQKKNMNIGLSTVYTATLNSVSILNEYYSETEENDFDQILYYAHGSGNTKNGDFDIVIPKGTNGSFDYVRGSKKYKEKLELDK